MSKYCSPFCKYGCEHTSSNRSKCEHQPICDYFTNGHCLGIADTPIDTTVQESDEPIAHQRINRRHWKFIYQDCKLELEEVLEMAQNVSVVPLQDYLIEHTAIGVDKRRTIYVWLMFERSISVIDPKRFDILAHEDKVVYRPLWDKVKRGLRRRPLLKTICTSYLCSYDPEPDPCVSTKPVKRTIRDLYSCPSEDSAATPFEKMPLVAPVAPVALNAADLLSSEKLD